MKLRYTETAAAEVADIFNYIAAENPRAAAELVARLERLTENLVEFPRMARVTDEQGTHIIPIGHYPYLVFYAIENEELVILHVRHGARRYPEK